MIVFQKVLQYRAHSISFRDTCDPDIWIGFAEAYDSRNWSIEFLEARMLQGGNEKGDYVFEFGFGDLDCEVVGRHRGIF